MYSTPLCTDHRDYKGREEHWVKLWLRCLGRKCEHLIRKFLLTPRVVLVIVLLLLCLNLHQTYTLSHLVSKQLKTSKPAESTAASKKPQAWIRGNNMHTGYLKHVQAVLESVGYNLDGGTYSDWTVLWSHEYPFNTLKDTGILYNLKPHQKVNKWPGSGFITSKVNLARLPMDNIPKAFKIPDESHQFRQYAQENPNTMWVQKSNAHRGIKIVPVKELDLNAKDTFIQRYVDNPMLIDGRKFDIGIYAIITSITPLRIYIVNHELLLRFCAHDYEPFNSADRDKYVVTDDYTPIWEMPSLKGYYNNGFTAKESFRAYLSERHIQADKIYEDIDKTIRLVYLSKISQIRNSMKQYNNRNFFEMVRFDFVLDDEAKLYLMEVNMSPNLSSKHFQPNQLLYEQVLYNLFHLIGIASPVADRQSVLSESERDMISASRDLSVNPNYCHSKCNGCPDTDSICKLCYKCMSGSEHLVYKSAYIEHVEKRTTKRVMPPEHLTRNNAEKPSYWSDLTVEDQLMHDWFQGKCDFDKSWC